MEPHQKVQQEYWDTLARNVEDEVSASHWVDTNSRAVESAMFQEIAAYLHHEYLKGAETATVLEVGCGNGLLLRPLRARLPSGCRLYGIDLSPEMLRRLGEIKGVTVQLGEAARLPHDDASLDFIYLHGVTQYFGSEEYMKEVLAELARCLRAGGSACLLDVPVSWYQDLMTSRSILNRALRRLKNMLATGQLKPAGRHTERVGANTFVVPAFKGYYADPDLFYRHAAHYQKVQLEIQPFRHKPLMYRRFRFNVRFEYRNQTPAPSRPQSQIQT